MSLDRMHWPKNQVIVQTLMRTLKVVISDCFGEEVAQVTFAQDRKMVKRFFHSTGLFTTVMAVPEPKSLYLMETILTAALLKCGAAWPRLGVPMKRM